MAIQFKFNKSAMHELGQQLKIRESALPTLKSKEAALRLEVKKAKELALEFDEKLKQKVKDMKDMVRLWVEFDEGLIKLKNATYSTRTIAGVRIPVLDGLEFELEPATCSPETRDKLIAAALRGSNLKLRRHRGE